MATLIKKNDIVKIKPEFLSAIEKEKNIVYIACDDEEKGRVIVEAQWGMQINPQEVITSDMIER